MFFHHFKFCLFNIPIVIKLTAWILFISSLQPSHCQQLSAEFVQVRLPFQSWGQSAFHDGNDLIYLIGGTGNADNQILQFSISSETIKVVGNLPVQVFSGSVQEDSGGNLFIFGCGDNGDQVYKFNPKLNSSEFITNLPFDIRYHNSIKYNATSNTVYIPGGYFQRQLLSFDMETTMLTNLTDLEFDLFNPTSVRIGNKAFIFDHSNIRNRQAFEFNLDTFEMLLVGRDTLPVFNWVPSSVWDESFVYVVGGYEANWYPYNGIIQFDPRTFDNRFIPVKNFPAFNTTCYHIAPTSVYVRNLNRIYFFGGQSFDSSNNHVWTFDVIYYVNLNTIPSPTTTKPTTMETTTGQGDNTTTLNPEYFSCVNRPDGKLVFFKILKLTLL